MVDHDPGVQECPKSWGVDPWRLQKIITLGGLQHLVLLNLNHCASPESLPHSFSLKSLITFSLSGCSKLEEFPEKEKYASFVRASCRRDSNKGATGSNPAFSVSLLDLRGCEPVRTFTIFQKPFVACHLWSICICRAAPGLADCHRTYGAWNTWRRLFSVKQLLKNCPHPSYLWRTLDDSTDLRICWRLYLEKKIQRDVLNPCINKGGIDIGHVWLDDHVAGNEKLYIDAAQNSFYTSYVISEII